MKPIYLKMEAFGPFKDSEEIDFKVFSSNELFLISGATGSGKTTIFDAMSYALFNEMTGDYRKDSMVRSQYADETKQCKVTFIFENNNKVYKIERSPKQKMLGRGNKLVEKSPTAFLYLDGKVIADRSNEVTKCVQDILGYDAKQFRKIVVLPQGKFIDILNAKPEEREAMLSTILQTTKYEKIAFRLKELASNFYNQIKDVDNQMIGILNASNMNSFDELADKVIEVSSDYKVKLEENNKLKNELENLNKLLNKAKNQENIIKQYNIILEEFNNLKENEDYYKQLSKKVDLIDKLKEAEKIENNYLFEQNSLKGLNEKLVKSKNDLEKSNLDLTEVLKKTDHIVDVNEKIIKGQNRIININSLKIEHKKYDELVLKNKETLKKINSLEKQLEVALKAEPELNKTLRDSENKLNKLQDELNNINNSKLILSQINVELSACKIKKDQLAKKEQYQSEINLLQDNMVLIDYEINELKEEYNKLLKLKDLFTASILASKLEEGEACPVCGSITHPNIAKNTNDISNDLIENCNNKLQGKITDKAKIEEKLVFFAILG